MEDETKDTGSEEEVEGHKLEPAGKQDTRRYTETVEGEEDDVEAHRYDISREDVPREDVSREDVPREDVAREDVP